MWKTLQRRKAAIIDPKTKLNCRLVFCSIQLPKLFDLKLLVKKENEIVIPRAAAVKNQNVVLPII